MTDPIRKQKAARWHALRAQGMSQEQATATVEQEFAGGGGGALDLAKGTGRALARGATVNFNDEIEAGLRTGFGMAGDYRGTRDQIRQEEEAFRETHPAVNLAAEVAGGFVPVMGAASKLGMATKLFPRSAARITQAAAKFAGKAPPTFLQQMGRGIGAGTAFGAAGGLGNAEELDAGAAVNAGIGGMIGGATGAVLTPIGALASKYAARRLAGTAGEDEATRIANEVLTGSVDDAGGVAALRAQRQADEALRPGLTSLADQSDATRAMADAAVSASPAAQATFKGELRNRTRGELGRIEQSLEQHTGLPADKMDAELLQRQLSTMRSKRFSGVMGSYERWARRADRSGHGVQMKPGTPIATGRGSWANWKEFGDTYAEHFKGADLTPPGPNPKAKELQQLRMKLMDRRANINTGPNQRAEITEVLTELDGILEHNSPEFRVIQKNFRNAMKRENAVEAGRAALATNNPDEVARQVVAMKPDEQELFRYGIAAGIKERLGGKDMDTKTANALFKGVGFMGKADTKSEVIRMAFTDPKQMMQFVDKVDLETRMGQTGQVGTNSLTAQRTAMQEKMGSGESLPFKMLRALGYTGPTGATFTGLATVLGQGKPDLKRKVAGKVANGLLDPAAANRTLQRAEQGGVENNLRNLWSFDLNPQVQGLLGRLVADRITN
jgi:hypothetical protein